MNLHKKSLKIRVLSVYILSLPNRFVKDYFHRKPLAKIGTILYDKDKEALL